MIDSGMMALHVKQEISGFGYEHGIDKL